MLINYALLPTLLELGSGRTFAETASKLRLTPSAVSHQMRALEAQLGFRLFERVGRRAKLTPEAERLVRVVGEHLPPIEAALESVLDDGMNVRGVVRLGGVLPFSRMWLRPRISHLLRTYSELTLEVTFGAPSVLIPKLQSGTLDLAIVAEAVDSPLLLARPIFIEEFWAVCSKAYLAGEPPPESAKDFGRQRFIVYDETRPMHAIWWRSMFGRSEPAAHSVACSIASLDEMWNLVEEGFGIGVLPNYLVRDSVSRGKLMKLAPRKKAGPKNPVYLVWRKASVETSRLKVVRDALIAAQAPGERKSG